MSTNQDPFDAVSDIELYQEDLEIEGLEDGVNPGFTTAFCTGTFGSASCPAGSASSASSVSSQGG